MIGHRKHLCVAPAHERSGFALLAVLWIMTGVAILGLGLSLSARGAIATAHNRMEATRARWHAEDCVERVRAVVAGELRADDTRNPSPASAALYLDEAVRASRLVSECDGTISFAPIGMAIDVNETTDESLRRFFSWRGTSQPRVDSLVDALLDWRDADDSPRPHGAEREWYERQGRSPPRNGAFAHTTELLRVRGFDAWMRAQPPQDSIDRLFTVEPGRIVLERAPAAVLASLPGITEATIARLMERRLRRAPPLNEVLALGGELSVASRDSLHRHYAELATRITLVPDAWLLSVLSRSGRGSEAIGPAATIELRLVRAGTRAAIVRRRTSP